MRILTTTAAIAALFLATAAPAAPKEAKPALWKLADSDTTIYLFGAIHALPAGYKWRDAKLDAAFKQADRLVVEAVVDRDPAKSSALLLGMGSAGTGLPPLIERVPEAKRPLLADLIARSKLPAAFLDGLETWTAALMLVGVTFRDLGVEPSNGVERTLEDEFMTVGKPIAGLETPQQQLGYFDAVSDQVQREFLLTLLDDPKKAKLDFEKMLASWSKGNQAEIAASFHEQMELAPALLDILLYKRNADWAQWAAKRLDQPGTDLVVVGAGHLAGEGSVLALLKAKGFKVQRIQ
jgi:uncharacterized protein YbaP (TraB family)